MAVYRLYLTRCESEAMQAATLPLLEKGRVQAEDLSALAIICQAVQGCASSRRAIWSSTSARTSRPSSWTRCIEFIRPRPSPSWAI